MKCNDDKHHLARAADELMCEVISPGKLQAIADVAQGRGIYKLAFHVPNCETVCCELCGDVDPFNSETDDPDVAPHHGAYSEHPAFVVNTFLPLEGGLPKTRNFASRCASSGRRSIGWTARDRCRHQQVQTEKGSPHQRVLSYLCTASVGGHMRVFQDGQLIGENRFRHSPSRQ